MRFSLDNGIAAFTLLWAATVSATPRTTLALSASTSLVECDKVAVYYPRLSRSVPVLLGNDGSATGGFRTWSLALHSSSPIPELSSKNTGRTKLVNVVYELGGRDVVVTLSQSDSLLRFFEAASVGAELPVVGGAKKVWGDFSSWCFWKSTGGQQYFYLFGKRTATLFLIREKFKIGIEVLEVQSFPVQIEAQTCAISQKTATVFFGGDSGIVYNFPASESTSSPAQILELGKVSDEISGLAVYVGNHGEDYLFVALPDSLAIYSPSNFTLLGEALFSEELELGDIAIYQPAISTKYPDGIITYAAKTDSGEQFGVSSLSSLFIELSLRPNRYFNPREERCKLCTPKAAPGSCPRVHNCASNGFCSTSTTCICFNGFTGASCESITCPNSCLSHGTCVSAGVCTCTAPWGGPDCSFLLVQAKYETDENGGDGDDPAIWIAPGNKTGNSRIITTTKSDLGAGFGIFDLTGKKLQTVAAAEPNNVDVIYGFPAGNRTIDLVFAACRGDNTLCLFEVTSDGELVSIPGGVQPTTIDDYEVYGSCVYRSRISNKQYLFVNSKTSEYLQFELTSTLNGTLQTTLVRSFKGGSGGQVEGCVADDENGFLFLGEEPLGLWRYDAEPNSTAEGYLIDHVDTGGNLFADVEGVTLIYGETSTDGYILVSCQGLSAYNIYQRAYPHKFVMTFSITAGVVDRVTNTDGITAVGSSLGEVFPRGLIVVHDDSNESPDGTVNAEAAFKLVDLGDVLGVDAVKKLDLLKHVDHGWDPRSRL